MTKRYRIVLAVVCGLASPLISNYAWPPVNRVLTFLVNQNFILDHGAGHWIIGELGYLTVVFSAWALVVWLAVTLLQHRRGPSQRRGNEGRGSDSSDLTQKHKVGDGGTTGQ